MKNNTCHNVFKQSNKNIFSLKNKKSALTTFQDDNSLKKTMKSRYIYCSSTKNQSYFRLNKSVNKKEIKINNRHETLFILRFKSPTFYNNIFKSKYKNLNKVKKISSKRNNQQSNNISVNNFNRMLFNQINNVNSKRENSKLNTISVNNLKNNKNTFKNFSMLNYSNKYNNDLNYTKRNLNETKIQKSNHYSNYRLTKKLNYYSELKYPNSNLNSRNKSSKLTSRILTIKKKINESRNNDLFPRLKSLTRMNSRTINKKILLSEFLKINNINIEENNNDESSFESKMINYNLGEINETPCSSKLSSEYNNKQNININDEMEKNIDQITKEAKEFLEVSISNNSETKISKNSININNEEKNENYKSTKNSSILCNDIEEYNDEERNKNIVSIFLK